MTVESFFDAIENQYANELPFVVYSQPLDSKIKCWLQEDAVVHTTTTFSESGFIFAPFDLNDNTVLFPKSHCEHMVIETDKIATDDFNTNTFPNESEAARDVHIDLVSKGINAIKTDEIKKVVLSRFESKTHIKEHPITIFKRLYDTYKNAMVYCWFHPKIGLWLGATPELLLKVDGRKLNTISLAGTQSFNESNTVNWNLKEIEEQQIVTDFICDNIKPYTNKIVTSNVETVRAGNLLHLKTKITGYIENESQLKPIIEALHPTPAVCGFPKQEAKDFILQNETYNREYYTGFFGELHLKQSKTRNTNRRNVENNAYAVIKSQTNLYVNLRCMQLKDNKALIYVGGGITKDSVAEDEWQETVNKAKTIGNILC